MSNEERSEPDERLMTAAEWRSHEANERQAGRRSGLKKVAKFGGGALVALLVLGGLFGEEPLPPVEVSSPLDACDKFWSTTTSLLVDQAGDAVAKSHIRALASGVSEVDPIQGSNLEDLADADNAADASDMMLLIMRRCVGVHGWPPPSQAELARIIELAR